MRTGRKTNYSPVRQMIQTLQNESSPIKLQHNKNHQHHPRINSNIKSNPEEVYIFDCCGTSKELHPSIEFMPTFRSLFFLSNFLVFVFGLADFGMGLWFRIDPKVYEIHKYIETQNFTIAGWIMLFTRFAACLIALIGFVAASQQVSVLLVFYFIMIALTLAFVGALVLLTVYGLGSSLEHYIVKEIYDQIRRRSMNNDLNLLKTNDAAQFLDIIQVKMRCCGAVNFRDYTIFGIVVPTICYTIDKNYVSAPGCGRAIRDLFDLRVGLAAGFTSVSIVVQLTTIFLSALMFCSIYHWRANPQRSALPVPSTSERIETPSQLYHHRPRSRTPIVVRS